MTAELVAGQEASAEGASASFGVAFSSDTIAGNMIIASSAVWEDTGDELSALITDTQSNLYIIAASATRAGTGGEESRIELQYAFNIIGGTTTVNSVDLGANTFRSIIISEWEGITTSDPLDPSINSADGSSTAPNAGSINPVGENLYIGVGGYEGNNPTVTAGGGYTKLSTEITSDARAPQYVLHAVGNGAKTALATLGTSLEWTIASAAFFESGQDVRSQVVAPFMPKLIDLIFRTPKSVDSFSGRLVTQDGDVLNDAGWNEDGWTGTGEDFIDHKADGRFHIPVQRYDISDIPAGATITTATIEWFWTGWSSGGVGDVIYQANDIADCPTLDASNNSTGWTKTTASVSEAMPTSGIVNEQSFITAELKTIIQELVDSYGGTLGEMGISITPTGPDPETDQVWSISDSSLGADVTARLSVSWTTPNNIDAEVTIFALNIGV